MSLPPDSWSARSRSGVSASAAPVPTVILKTSRRLTMRDLGSGSRILPTGRVGPSQTAGKESVAGAPLGVREQSEPTAHGAPAGAGALPRSHLARRGSSLQGAVAVGRGPRSEEHTSELQS